MRYLRGRTGGLREIGGNGDKREFFKIVGLEGRRGSWDFTQKFLEEGGDKGEDMGGDTGSYLERERNLSSDMEEEICGEEGEGKTGGGFTKDSVIWSSSLLIKSKTSFRARLFRRFRIRLNCARDLRRHGTCGCTKIWTYYGRPNYLLWIKNLASH